MKKHRLKKLADQELNFPYGVLFGENSPFEGENILPKKTNKQQQGTINRTEWEFMKPIDNMYWKIQQGSRIKNKK